MAKAVFCLVAASLALVASALAQTGDVRAAAEQRIEQARLDARHRGDERLSCGQLERELTAIVRDPAVQEHLTSRNATAPRDASAVFDSFPADTLAAEIAAADAQIDRLSERARTLEFLAAKMTELLPNFMRGARVRDLARARSCRFVRAWECTRC